MRRAKIGFKKKMLTIFRRFLITQQTQQPSAKSVMYATFTEQDVRVLQERSRRLVVNSKRHADISYGHYLFRLKPTWPAIQHDLEASEEGIGSVAYDGIPTRMHTSCAF